MSKGLVIRAGRVRKTLLKLSTSSSIALQEQCGHFRRGGRGRAFPEGSRLHQNLRGGYDPRIE